MFAQQAADLEYIVVDGGSTDGSRELIEAHSDKLHWWCSKPDGGQYAAINEGFGHSSGEIMGWLNASDLYFPYTLKTVERIFEQNPSIDWITAQSKVTINEIGDLAYFGTALGYSRRAFRAGLHSGADNFGFIQQESCFWRRKLWNKIGGRIPDQCRFAADFHLWSLFFEHAPLAAVGAPLAAFRYHGDQRSTDTRYFEEVSQVLELMKVLPDVAHERQMVSLTPLHAGNSNFSWTEASESDDILFHSEASLNLVELNQTKVSLLEAMQGRGTEIEVLNAACAERLAALEATNAKMQRLERELVRLKTEGILDFLRRKISGTKP